MQFRDLESINNEMNVISRLKLTYMDYDRFFDEVYNFMENYGKSNQLLENLDKNLFFKVNCIYFRFLRYFIILP